MTMTCSIKIIYHKLYFNHAAKCAAVWKSQRINNYRVGKFVIVCMFIAIGRAMKWNETQCTASGCKPNPCKVFVVIPANCSWAIICIEWWHRSCNVDLQEYKNVLIKIAAFVTRISIINTTKWRHMLSSGFKYKMRHCHKSTWSPNMCCHLKILTGI